MYLINKHHEVPANIIKSRAAISATRNYKCPSYFITDNLYKMYFVKKHHMTPMNAVENTRDIKYNKKTTLLDERHNIESLQNVNSNILD